MKSALLLAAAVLLASGAPAGAFYVAGSFNGWDAAGNIMLETNPGFWEVDLQLDPNARYEYKVTVGDWGTSWPGSGNSWFVTDDTGSIKLTYDTNTYSDGWSGSSQRLGVSTEPGSWTAVGDWQGWNNANPATQMAAQGNGIYSLQQDLAPGTWYYKAVNTGTWDSIGADARSINGDNLAFEITAENPTAIFWVDALNGTIQVEVVPEPSSLLALGSGFAGLTALLRRRR